MVQPIAEFIVLSAEVAVSLERHGSDAIRVLLEDRENHLEVEVLHLRRKKSAMDDTGQHC